MVSGPPGHGRTAAERHHESAEADRNPFTSDAIGMLHEAAGGSLRDIDRISTMSLKNASRRNLRRIDSAVIEHVLKLEDDRRCQ